MDLVNDSAFEASWIVTQIEPPAFALTALVKGTFTLNAGARATLAEEQLPLTGDELDEAGVLRYPFDFAPFKPRTDVLVHGAAHAPDGQPVTSLRVRVRLGSIAKSLQVVGDRYWLEEARATAPEPFVEMPLTWDRAFGGRGFANNPLGRGHLPIELPDGRRVHPLPNVEVAGRPIRTWSDMPPPGGLGPVPDTWPERWSKVGHFTADYLKERWPAYPRDFDWSYFNTAPLDQQIDGYVNGDEPFALDHLHPSIAQYRGYLPGLRAKAFLNEWGRGRQWLREVPLRLDTVSLDVTAERLVLVWRGHVPVKTEQLDEVLHLFVTAESTSDEPKPIDAYEVLFLDALDRQDEDDEELDEEDDEELAEEVDEPAVITLDDGSELAAAGVPLQMAAVEVAAPLPAESQAEPIAVADADVEAEAAEDATLTRERVQEMLAQRSSFQGLDLGGLSLQGLDFSGCDLRDAMLEHTVLLDANLSGADLGGATLTRANLRESRCVGTNFAGADLTGAWFHRADLQEANLTGADLTGARLRSARLVAIEAVEAVFVEADLSDADLQQSNLTGADFSDARLHRANLDEANLNDAALMGAWGQELTARRTRLDRLRAAEASLAGADFSEARGDESVWESADLFGARFVRAVLPQAEFSLAYLPESVFDGATLTEARFNEADLRRARLVRCNLYEASLGKADLTGADLTESNLFSATLMDATLDRTNLRGANLRRVKSREMGSTE